MINVFIKTKRVYSHDKNGIPKFEVIEQSVQDGGEFNKFLKYLPVKGYITDEMEITKVTQRTKNGVNEIDKMKWVEKLNSAIKSLTEEKVSEKEQLQKQNQELLKRIEALEWKKEPKVETVIEPPAEKPKDFGLDAMSLPELKKRYEEVVGKKPHYNMNRKTLTERILKS